MRHGVRKHKHPLPERRQTGDQPCPAQMIDARHPGDIQDELQRWAIGRTTRPGRFIVDTACTIEKVPPQVRQMRSASLAAAGRSAHHPCAATLSTRSNAREHPKHRGSARCTRSSGSVSRRVRIAASCGASSAMVLTASSWRADDHPGGPSQRQGGQEYRIAQEGRLGLRVHHASAGAGEQTCWLAWVMAAGPEPIPRAPSITIATRTPWGSNAGENRGCTMYGSTLAVP